MKKEVKKKVSKSKDFTPLVLYDMGLKNYLKGRKFFKELEEYIVENYKFKKDSKEDFEEFVESYISDSVYGDEEDTETFIKDFNKVFIHK